MDNNRWLKLRLLRSKNQLCSPFPSWMIREM